ncbi:MAG: hypothetical protein ABS910_07245 [Arthrobacter sp.]
MKKIMGVAAIAAILALTGCGGGETESPAAPSVEPAKGTESPQASPSASAGPEKSPRGNLVKELGEGAGMSGENGEQVFTFAVNSIAVDPGCTSEYATAPENGHFVVLDISVETHPAMADDQFMNPLNLSAHNIKLIAPNGTTSNASLATGSAYMCLNDAEMLPSAFGPAEKATGKIVVDTESPNGTLIVSAYGQDAWEYNF